MDEHINYDKFLINFIFGRLESNFIFINKSEGKKKILNVILIKNVGTKKLLYN